METIEKYIEQLISLTGINGDTIPVMRHILLVLAAFLLAFLAGYVCRKLLVPLILKLTAKTDTMGRCAFQQAGACGCMPNCTGHCHMAIAANGVLRISLS